MTTVGVTVDRRRTVAASAARRRAKTHRLMVEVAARLDDADDAHLEAMLEVVRVEVVRVEVVRVEVVRVEVEARRADHP